MFLNKCFLGIVYMNPEDLNNWYSTDIHYMQSHKNVT